MVCVVGNRDGNLRTYCHVSPISFGCFFVEASPTCFCIFVKCFFCNFLLEVDLKMFLYLGASFSLWTGGIASAVDGVAVLVCVAMNGFHSKVSYQWYSKAGVLNMAIHPVIYLCGVPR